MTHEDNRRILTSIPYKDGEIKIIVDKEDCILGAHYHEIKTETFILIKGHANIRLHDIKPRTKERRYDSIEDLEFFKDYIVLPKQYHTFTLKKDSVLFCICSHPYNENDDYTTCNLRLFSL